ncbi:alpha/beta hydrolase [Syntrophomonas curvata]
MFMRTDADFYSQKTRCAAWLYRPEGVDNPPVIIMAHGFAAERAFRLPAFAEYFAGHGLAVLLFDYRCFGDSDGTPRNLVSCRRHLQDWQAAIDHVSELEGVDRQRIALWGSSFSGGHVLVAAANNPEISAVVSQVPFVDGVSSTMSRGPGFMLRASGHGLRDFIRCLFGRPPHYVPVVGEPGTFAVMNTPESMPGYTRMKPPGSNWQNRCPARILPLSMFYRPITRAAGVKCPVLLIMAEQDSLIPRRKVEQTASRLSSAELLRLTGGHFEVYFDQCFEYAVEKELAFLTEHLGAQ